MPPHPSSYRPNQLTLQLSRPQPETLTRPGSSNRLTPVSSIPSISFMSLSKRQQRGHAEKGETPSIAERRLKILTEHNRGY